MSDRSPERARRQPCASHFHDFRLRQTSAIDDIRYGTIVSEAPLRNAHLPRALASPRNEAIHADETSSYELLVAALRERLAGKAYRAIIDDGSTFLARMETCAVGLSGQGLANTEFVRSQVHSLEAVTYVRLHQPAKAVEESQATIDASAPALDDASVLPEFRARMRGLSQATAKLRDDILSGRCDCSAR